jgi:hypothetical protein
MWPDNGGDNQKWHFDEDMTIRSELGYVLAVRDGRSQNSTPLVASNKQGEEHQKFRIVPAPE